MKLFKNQHQYLLSINCITGIITKYDADGELVDSYIIASNELYIKLSCSMILLLNDGSYITQWSSFDESSGFGVSSTSSLYN